MAAQRQHALGKSQEIHTIMVNIVLIILMRTVIAKQYCLCFREEDGTRQVNSSSKGPALVSCQAGPQTSVCVTIEGAGQGLRRTRPLTSHPSAFLFYHSWSLLRSRAPFPGLLCWEVSPAGGDRLSQSACVLSMSEYFCVCEV